MSTTITIKEHHGTLVVDSRLVALELGIKHGDWFNNTLLKYQQEIEQDFGVFCFENGKPQKGSRGGRPERFAWLTEEQATVLMTYSRNTEQVRQCKRNLVKAFLEAKRIASEIIPKQSQEIEKLKLQLELAKTQEKLLSATSAIATMHSPEMVALVLGKPDAIVTQIKEVPTVITVDHRGNAIAQFDGIGIMALANRYGFGNNTKACRKWLESVGIKDEQWLTEPALVKSKKLPREMLTWLDKQFAHKKGTRQIIIGETLFTD